MTVLITLSSSGASSGPLYDLYSNIDYVTPLASGVTKSALTAGYSLSGVPDTAITIRITSTGPTCTNSIDVTITGGGTTTTTSSTTAATTGSITINNNSNNPSVTIQEVYVNNILINLNPITAGATLVSTYTVIAGNAQTVYVLTNNAMDSPVKLTISTTPTQTPCLITTGNVTFTGLDLSTGPSINLDLGGEGEACD